MVTVLIIVGLFDYHAGHAGVAIAGDRRVIA
jgi:hypothetical protein